MFNNGGKKFTNLLNLINNLHIFGDVAINAKTLMAKLLDKVLLVKFGLPLKRTSKSCKGIFTGHTSLHAPHKLDANGKSE